MEPACSQSEALRGSKARGALRGDPGLESHLWALGLWYEACECEIGRLSLGHLDTQGRPSPIPQEPRSAGLESNAHGSGRSHPGASLRLGESPRLKELAEPAAWQYGARKSALILWYEALETGGTQAPEPCLACGTASLVFWLRHAIITHDVASCIFLCLACILHTLTQPEYAGTAALHSKYACMIFGLGLPVQSLEIRWTGLSKARRATLL